MGYSKAAGWIKAKTGGTSGAPAGAAKGGVSLPPATSAMAAARGGAASGIVRIV
jgi:hypothetical protein